MKETDKTYCRILLDVLEEHEISEYVVSPGTRNAPLLISLSYREKAKCHVMTDERTAAFTALGLAMVKQRPVVLICTSGTALYNYAPAVAEAFHQGIPLIVITADRPAKWIDQNDSQTLIQPGALEKIVKKSFDIPIDSGDGEEKWFVNRCANEAALLCVDSRPGPVHVNIQFDSPVSNTIEKTDSHERIIKTISPTDFLSPKHLNYLADQLMGKKVLVIAGFMLPDNSLNKALVKFSSLPGIKILCETISNLHLEGNVYAIDSVIAGLSREQKFELRPDIVISIGGALISGMLKTMVRELKPEIWTLGDTPFSVDCYKNLKLNIKASPFFFFNALYAALRKRYEKNAEARDLIPKLKDYSLLWSTVKEQQLKERENFIKKADWSELKAFHTIFRFLPENYNLFLSNGTCVRYAQLFTSRLPHASYSNRGVSGIEGTSATALGCALGYKGPTLLITGDMSFAYDTGILGYKNRPGNFKIIVISNHGGGIFRFISPTRYIEHRDSFFCADPEVPVEGLATAYGWTYLKAENLKELENSLPILFSSENNTLLEIISDEEYSASLLRKYMRINACNPF